MQWFGHRSDCATPHTPDPRSTDVLACATCMPDVAPRCGICDAEARELGRQGGFRRLSFVGLCPSCVATVRGAGPWRTRRAAALAARVRTLSEAHPALAIEHAPSGKRVVMSGMIGERHVRFTLRTGTREHEDERYVFRVELLAERELGAVDPSAVVFGESFAPRPSRGSPSVVRDDHRWLRIAFLHLGRTDTLTVVDAMLLAATALDAASLGGDARGRAGSGE